MKPKRETTLRAVPENPVPELALAGESPPASRLPPNPSEGSIPRPRLVARLLASRSARLVLLEAPAGFSKSTCLSQWGQADERVFCRLDCGSLHDDPAALVEAIIGALEPVHSCDPQTLMALGSPQPDLHTAMTRLGAELSSIEIPIVLVIDDSHLLRAEGTSQVLQAVMDGLSDGSQLALASRTRPDLPLGGLRAKRALLEVGASDLAMTRGESAQLLGSIGLELDEEQVELIHARTEGWPAALYLAGLALDAQDGDIDQRVRSFSGDDRLVVDYFRDEFLNGIAVEQADFLYRTSCLEELSGSLCDAALERSDSALVLDGLARSNTMVVPLDRRGERYRYHHLFAEMLRSELRLRDPEAESRIHSRAARWFADRGELRPAVEHAISSGDMDLTGRLIWQAFPEMSGRGQIATLARWLDETGDQGIASSPGLIFARAHLHLATGEGGKSIYWANVAASEIAGYPEFEADLLNLRSTLCIGGVAQMAADSAKASELFDPTSPWLSPSRFFEGVAAQLTGDQSRAEHLLKESALIGAVLTPIMQAMALAQLTLLYVDQGRLREALLSSSQARAQVDRCGLSEMPIMAVVFASSALAYSLEGKPEAAHAALNKANQLISGLAVFPAWFEAELCLTICRTWLRLGRPGKASDGLSKAMALADSCTGATTLEVWANEARAVVVQQGASLSQRGSDLTKAELRTLQYLPSHHSFRAIGALLNLSQNTVKTQANSLYRKLGANSRAEAVMVAREAGLLDQDEVRPLSS